tara:strand:- start:533 stop:943 length:411 start_codon:yes stop_codon:yes gene_type:complete
MNQKIKETFLILVLVQGLHSIEEYVGKLWENFPPARVLCSLVSDNLVTGFLIINIGLFVFGLLCWLFPIRKNYFYAQFLVWFWIVLELINGIGHPIWTIVQKAYTPGILTAPFLFVIAIILLRKQLNEKPNAQQNL